jgi:hypothetical protein
MNVHPNKPNFDVDAFSVSALEFYNQIKSELEVTQHGKYVALDAELGKHWLGDTTTEALQKAKSEAPDKIFYVALIGAPSTFIVQSIRNKSAFAF